MDSLLEFVDLWDKYLDNFENLSDDERQAFCRFMNEAAKPPKIMSRYDDLSKTLPRQGIIQRE